MPIQLFNYSYYLVHFLFTLAIFLSSPIISFGQTQKKIYASDGTPSNSFGQSLDVEGEWMVVGDNYRNIPVYNSGAVYVFHLENEEWVETQIIAPTDSIQSHQFGHSVDIFGEWMAIGAVYSPIGTDTVRAPGAVHMYRLNNTTNEWSFAQTVFPDVFTDNMQFGTDVSIYGNWLIVGAPGLLKGKAFLYEFDGIEWKFLRHFESEIKEYDEFGNSVDIWNKTVVAGEDYKYIYVYEFIDEVWHTNIISIGDEELLRYTSNTSLSLRNDQLLIGLKAKTSFDIGAFLYHKTDTGWVESHRFLDHRIDNGGLGGYVFLGDNLLAIGALGIDPAVSGAIAYYAYEDSNWQFQQQFFPENPVRNSYYGSVFRIAENQIYVGAFGDHGLSERSGVVYQIDLNTFQPLVSTTYDTGLGSLRYVIEHAQPGDTIRFTRSMNGDTIKLTSGVIDIDKTLFIQGNGKIHISGTDQQGIFNIGENTLVKINGVNFYNGNSAKGGAIENNGNLNLTHAIFEFNRAEAGGAIYNMGILEIDSTDFFNNTAQINGGAIYNDSTGHISIKYAQLQHNQATNGGSIYQANEANLDISYSSITHSSASQMGGGIYHSGEGVLHHTTIASNTAENGGGVFNNGMLDLKSLTISQNKANAIGGGIYNLDTIASKNNVIVQNEASSNPDIFNQGSIQSDGYNFVSISDEAGITPSIGDSLGISTASIDPKLDSLQNIGGRTLGRRPLFGSPLIDAGADSDSLDQRGFLRDHSPDKGAIELLCDYFPIVTNTLSSGPGSLPFIIEHACPGATVLFADSLQGDTIKLDGEYITIDKNLTITGPGAENLTIDADYKNRIFTISGWNKVRISGLKLIRGNLDYNNTGSSYHGGALVNQGDLELEECIFSQNVASGSGSAIYGQGTLSINRCQFIDNGRIVGVNYGYLGLIAHTKTYIDNSFFKGNYAWRGAAIFNEWYNGGDESYEDECIVKNSTFTENIGDDFLGQVIYARNTKISIINCSFFKNGRHNYPEEKGMISLDYAGRMQIINSTIVNNHLTALYFTGALTIGNTIVSANFSNLNLSDATSTDGDTAIITLGHNLIGVNDNFFPMTKSTDIIGTEMSPVDPGLDSLLKDNGGPTPTLALLPHSIAIDAGNSFDESYDQRGVERIGIADIGAYEFGCRSGAAVSTLADDGPGSLREAIRVASSGDTLRFSGCFIQDTIQLSSSLYIDKDLVIMPENVGQIVFKGDSGFSIIQIAPNTTVSFHHAIFWQAQAASGGAIYNEGELELVRSKISHTEAEFGGAIYNAVGASLHMNIATIAHSSATKGGAIYNEGETTFENSAITYTSADSGGAIFNAGIYTLHNSTLAQDSATVGGAIYQSNGKLKISSSTISANVADSAYGGVYAPNDFDVQNSLIAGNHAPEHPDIFVSSSWNSLGYNLIGVFPYGISQTDSTDMLGSTANPIDPLLQELGHNGGFSPTMALFACSPAIDMGNAGNEKYDQRGELRDTPADIGAFDGEAIYESGNVVSNTYRGGPGSLAYTMDQAQAGDTIWIDECLAGKYIDMTPGDIWIEKDLVIMGIYNQPPILYLKEGGAMFSIRNNVSVHIQDVIFSDETPDSVNSIRTFIHNYGSLSALRCVFRESDLRAIYNRGPLSLKSCTFNNLQGNDGSAIFNSYAGESINVVNCQFIDNEAYRGVIDNSGNINIDSCYFARNFALIGSCIYNYGENAHLNLQNSLFEENLIKKGAIYNGSYRDRAYANIVNTRFIKNEITESNIHAVIFNYSLGTMTISDVLFEGSPDYRSNPISNYDSLFVKNSTFTNNNRGSGNGGAIFLFEGYLSAINSTFTNNKAGEGGALKLYPNTRADINSCTIVNNEANSGGGIYNAGGELNIQNTILALNEASVDGKDIFAISNQAMTTSLGYNLVGNVENYFPTTNANDLLGTSTNPIDPRLALLNNNGGLTPTIALLPESPAINAGNSGEEAFDQRGLPRDAQPDIGAYEFGSSTECVFAYWEAGEQLGCNDSTATYMQAIKLYYFSPPDSSSLILTWENDSISDSLILGQHQSPLELFLTVPLNSGSWNLSAWFEEDPLCRFRANNFFEAPESCSRPDPIPIYRINAGGIEMTDSLLNWSIDKQNTPSQYVNADGSNNTTGWDGDENFDNTTHAPTKLFGTHRWDGSWGDEMSWTFPVDNGDYLVNLFFAENRSNSAAIGARVFDVSIEGSLVLDKLDVFATTGFRVAHMQTFETSVDDGMLNIDLQRFLGNPMISGLEILSLNGSQRKGKIPGGLKVYPNPAIDNLQIEVPLEGKGKLIIFSATGQKILETNVFIPHKSQLYIGNLPAGIYHLFLQIGSDILQAKFSKR